MPRHAAVVVRSAEILKSNGAAYEGPLHPVRQYSTRNTRHLPSPCRRLTDTMRSSAGQFVEWQRTTLTRLDCDLFSESGSPLLWKIPHIPNSMNIKQTLTFAVIALLAGSFAFSDDLKSLLTRPGVKSATRLDSGREAESRNRAAGVELAQAEKPAVGAKDDSQPLALLLSASERLKSHSSVRANITNKVSMFLLRCFWRTGDAGLAS